MYRSHDFLIVHGGTRKKFTIPRSKHVLFSRFLYSLYSVPLNICHVLIQLTRGRFPRSKAATTLHTMQAMQPEINKNGHLVSITIPQKSLRGTLQHYTTHRSPQLVWREGEFCPLLTFQRKYRPQTHLVVLLRNRSSFGNPTPCSELL